MLWLQIAIWSEKIFHARSFLILRLRITIWCPFAMLRLHITIWFDNVLRCRFLPMLRFHIANYFIWNRLSCSPFPMLRLHVDKDLIWEPLLWPSLSYVTIPVNSLRYLKVRPLVDLAWAQRWKISHKQAANLLNRKQTFITVKKNKDKNVQPFTGFRLWI